MLLYVTEQALGEAYTTLPWRARDQRQTADRIGQRDSAEGERLRNAQRDFAEAARRQAEELEQSEHRDERFTEQSQPVPFPARGQMLQSLRVSAAASQPTGQPDPAHGQAAAGPAPTATAAQAPQARLNQWAGTRFEHVAPTD